MNNKELFSKCPYCGWANKVTVLADLVCYKCKKCSGRYYVKKEISYITITPSLTGGNIEAVSLHD